MFGIVPNVLINNNGNIIKNNIISQKSFLDQLPKEKTYLSYCSHSILKNLRMNLGKRVNIMTELRREKLSKIMHVNKLMTIDIQINYLMTKLCDL